MNLLNASPLEIQYRVFDLLDYIALARTRIVDELYYTRRHRSKFAAVLREIEEIEYSIDGSISTTLIRNWRTIYEWHCQIVSGKIRIKLTAKSRILRRKLGSVTEFSHAKYKRDLDGGIKLLRTITTKHRFGYSYTRFYEEIAFKHAGDYHAID